MKKESLPSLLLWRFFSPDTAYMHVGGSVDRVYIGTLWGSWLYVGGSVDGVCIGMCWGIWLYVGWQCGRSLYWTHWGSWLYVGWSVDGVCIGMCWGSWLLSCSLDISCCFDVLPRERWGGETGQWLRIRGGLSSSRCPVPHGWLLCAQSVRPSDV